MLQDSLQFRVKIARNFDVFTHWCANCYFRLILEKILVFAYSDISWCFIILSYFVVLLNFKKQFQELLSKFKIKHISETGQICQLISSMPAHLALTPAGLMGPNSQVLGHQTTLLNCLTAINLKFRNWVSCSILQYKNFKFLYLWASHNKNDLYSCAIS